jgi:hypothetical protein
MRIATLTASTEFGLRTATLVPASKAVDLESDLGINMTFEFIFLKGK